MLDDFISPNADKENLFEILFCLKVHALADDLGQGVGKKRQGSLKTGNAGARVACGIIYYA